MVTVFVTFFRSMTFKTPKRYCDNSAVVILGFSILSGTNSQILPPKRYDEHPHHFYRGVPPGYMLWFNFVFGYGNVQ